MREDGKGGVAIVLLLMRELNSEWLQSAGAWILDRKLIGAQGDHRFFYSTLCGMIHSWTIGLGWDQR